MKIHLVDGTYELFRGFYGPPPKKAPDGREVGATIQLMRSMLTLLTQSGATHVAVAFDHEIRSFRNDLYAGYKTGDDIDPILLSQFDVAEEAMAALGFVVWPMVDYEADDAIATATLRYAKDPRVEQIVICTPDKDLTQLVVGDNIVCWDRRREIIYDEAAVKEKYGVAPQSIPDYLALVGDAADGISGIKAWGAKSSATVLSKYMHIEDIDMEFSQWDISPGRAKRLAANLSENMADALLYRRLTTLAVDVPLTENIDDLEWKGAATNLQDFCDALGLKDFVEKVPSWPLSE